MISGNLADVQFRHEEDVGIRTRKLNAMRDHVVDLETLTAGSALTGVNDTNITLTFGGTPATALLRAASITVGWQGTLEIARGGTGSSTASGARTALGLEIGTDVQAQNANLQAIAGQTTAADRLTYWSGSGAASLATFTAAGRALVDDADAAAQRSTLGLGTAATKNTGTSGDAIPLLNADNTFSGKVTIANATAGASGLDARGPTGARLVADFNGANINFSDATTHLIRANGGGTTFLTINSSAVNSTVPFQRGGTQVVNTRRTGWATATGTAARTTYATYAAPTISNPPTQAEVQAIADHVQILSQHLKALIDDLHSTAGHGLIGT